MSVLSDADIRKFLAEGRLVIAPFVEKRLTPNGYDLGIAEVCIPDNRVKVTAGIASVPPQSRFIVSTEERVELNGPWAANLWIRTSWARKGVLASFGVIDSGFRGTLTLAAFNSGGGTLDIKIGDTFAQMVFSALSSEPEKGYGKRSGHYQDQKGVTLARE
ncbi:MAG: dCTP deaminase [Euryarchaeota archaeon]|nr:dCTP deaminase [Euryarchaeota archaeon]